MTVLRATDFNWKYTGVFSFSNNSKETVNQSNLPKAFMEMEADISSVHMDHLIHLDNVRQDNLIIFIGLIISTS